MEMVQAGGPSGPSWATLGQRLDQDVRGVLDNQGGAVQRWTIVYSDLDRSVVALLQDKDRQTELSRSKHLTWGDIFWNLDLEVRAILGNDVGGIKQWTTISLELDHSVVEMICLRGQLPPLGNPGVSTWAEISANLDHQIRGFIGSDKSLIDEWTLISKELDQDVREIFKGRVSLTNTGPETPMIPLSKEKEWSHIRSDLDTFVEKMFKAHLANSADQALVEWNKALQDLDASVDKLLSGRGWWYKWIKLSRKMFYGLSALLLLLILAAVVGVAVHFGRSSPAGPEPEEVEPVALVDCGGDGYAWVNYGNGRSLKVKSFRDRRETFGAAKALCVAENAAVWEVFGDAPEWLAVVERLDLDNVGVGETWLGAIPVAKACEDGSYVCHEKEAENGEGLSVLWPSSPTSSYSRLYSGGTASDRCVFVEDGPKKLWLAGNCDAPPRRIVCTKRNCDPLKP